MKPNLAPRLSFFCQQFSQCIKYHLELLVTGFSHYTVSVLLEAHTRNNKDISYIEQRDLLPLLGVSEIAWTVHTLNGDRTIEDGVTPDYTFRIIFNQELTPNNFATFFLEADRGTEPNYPRFYQLEHVGTSRRILVVKSIGQ